MKHAAKALVSTIVFAIVLSGCAAGTDVQTTATVINLIAVLMGVTPDQATAGKGALLGLASEKLTPQDHARVAATIPGAPCLVQRAGEMTGLGNHFGTIANVTAELSRVGLTPAQVQTMATNLGDYAGKAGGAAVRNLLMGALQ